MPDPNLAAGMLAASRILVHSQNKKPSQAHLRRSISTAYSALFLYHIERTEPPDPDPTV